MAADQIDLDRLLARILQMVRCTAGLEGALFHGSLATDARDDYSDVDLVIVSGDSDRIAPATRGFVRSIVEWLGPPLAQHERRWEQFYMVEMLYDKRRFPPIGLSIDLTFSTLRYLPRLMRGAARSVAYDRRGQVKSRLRGVPDRPRIRRALPSPKNEPMVLFPFYLYEANKAWVRSDLANWHGMLEELRRIVFHVAALREGVEAPGRTKRALRLLAPRSRKQIVESYGSPRRNALREITAAYLTELGRSGSHVMSASTLRETRTVLSGVV
jgi:hypothetical protein